MGRTIFGLLVAVAAGVPLLIVPGFSLYFDITPKVVLLLCGAAAVLLIPRAWLGGWGALWREPLGRVWLVLLTAHGASLLLSTLFSTQPAVSFAGSNWRRFGLVTHGSVMLFAAIFSGYFVIHRDRLGSLLRVLTLGGLAAALYGILQYFGIDPLLPPQAYHIGEGEWTIVRTPGTMGHAGYFATYLVAVVFWAAALGQSENRNTWRMVAYATAALGSFAVVLSGTRGAILGLLAGATVVALWRGPRMNRRTIAIAMLTASALAIFYVSPPGEKLRGRTRWYIEDAAGGGRLWLWRDSLRMFAAGPWVHGTGLETYGAEFPRFLSPELARAYPNRYYESPHNIFADALTTQGLLGFFFLAGMTALAAAAIWRVRRSGLEAGVWFAAAFVASLCGNQFLAFTLPTALYFYLSVCLLIVVAIPAVQPGGAEHWSRWGWLVAAPAAATLLIFSGQLAAVDAQLPGIQKHAESGNIGEAIVNYQQLLRIKPWGMSADIWFSRIMIAAAQRPASAEQRAHVWAAATEAAERAAQQADERQAACYNLAVVYGLQNDAPRAEGALRRTIQVAPNWYKPRWMLAQLLRETGRLEEAVNEAERAAGLNAGADPEVAQTRDQLRLILRGNTQ